MRITTRSQQLAGLHIATLLSGLVDASQAGKVCKDRRPATLKCNVEIMELTCTRHCCRNCQTLRAGLTTTTPRPASASGRSPPRWLDPDSRQAVVAAAAARAVHAHTHHSLAAQRYGVSGRCRASMLPGCCWCCSAWGDKGPAVDAASAAAPAPAAAVWGRACSPDDDDDDGQKSCQCRPRSWLMVCATGMRSGAVMGAQMRR